MNAIRQRIGGFTLIEVLVTVIVMTVGLLGLASLQLAAMKNNYSAYQRTQAVIAAYDLVDRLRIAPSRAADANYTTDAPDQANAVFAAWSADLQASPLALTPPPSGPLGALDCSATNSCGQGNCGITIRWNDARPEAMFGGNMVDSDARAADQMALTICTRLPEPL